MTVLVPILTVLSLLLSAGPVPPITVRLDQVIRKDAERVLGVNLNYLRDLDANRPGSPRLAGLLKDMRVAWLRFPGGEKSDFHLWSKPPYAKPEPSSIGWYANSKDQRMDIDAYMRIVREVVAEPYVVVGYDNVARSGRTELAWRNDAVALVRYVNTVKRYGIRHWEIGNENWHNQTAEPEAMAQIVQRFAKAMRAVDPTILIGASGNGTGWWNRFLPGAASSLNFLTVSNYPAYNFKSYEGYARVDRTYLTGQIRDAVSAGRRFGNLPVIVAETNSKDFGEQSWPDGNNLGHSLMTFDLLGMSLSTPGVRSAMVWTTRWQEDEEAARSQWYAFGPRNEVLPTGRAIELWTRYLLPELLDVEGGSSSVFAFAARSRDHRMARIWIVNRGLEAEQVALQFQGGVPKDDANAVIYQGNGDDDMNPTIRAGSRTSLNRPIAAPPRSIQVLTVKVTAR